jgi:hypothetical protein
MTVFIPVVFNGDHEYILGVYKYFFEAQLAPMNDLSEFGEIDHLEIYIYEWEVGDEQYTKVFDYDKTNQEWIEQEK